MAASGPIRSRLVPGLLVRLVLGVDLDADAHELEQCRAEPEPTRLDPRNHEEDEREDWKDNDARDPQGQHDRTLQRPFALLPRWVTSPAADPRGPWICYGRSARLVLVLGSADDDSQDRQPESCRHATRLGASRRFADRPNGR
jgi:hypothetical protein